MMMKKQLTIALLATTIAFGSQAMLAHPVSAAADAVIVSSVSFRTAPDSGSTRIRYIQDGENVDILEKVNSWWYKIKDSRGQVGYISTSSQYVKVLSGSVTPTQPADTSALRTKIINAGKAYLGTPYEYGSDRSTTKTFDCSDFIKQAFKDGAGITLPSDSRAQGDYVKSIGRTTKTWSNLKPGDLMFFMEYRSSGSYPSDKSGQRITHAGIYIGDGKILHTYSKASGGVRIDAIDGKHWEKRFIFGGSALK